MNCPICNVQLVMSERQGIEIDYCPTCRGIWLDRGELDKIIERSVSELPQRSPKDIGYGHDHHEKHQNRKYYKKRSFLHDLFD
jgi:Zn-finger nucleic acid-binding protein